MCHRPKHLDNRGGSTVVSTAAFSQRQITIAMLFNQSFTRADGYRKCLIKEHFKPLTNGVIIKTMNCDFCVIHRFGLSNTGRTYQNQLIKIEMARPAVVSQPFGSEQQAGIYNTFFGGIAHEAKYQNLTHTLSVFGSYTDFENPFITTTNTELKKSWR